MPTKNPLKYVPGKYRHAAYVVLFLASIAFGAWQAADGNITNFVGALVVALSGALAASNTDRTA